MKKGDIIYADLQGSSDATQRPFAPPLSPENNVVYSSVQQHTTVM